MEVFIEFIDHYIKKGSEFEKREIRELLERTINGLKENIPKVNKEDLEELQTIFISGIEIEEINGNYLMKLNPKETETFFHNEPFSKSSGWDLDGFSGALDAIQFITVVKFPDTKLRV